MRRKIGKKKIWKTYSNKKKNPDLANSKKEDQEKEDLENIFKLKKKKKKKPRFGKQ